jgi:hypothetical protein
LSRFFFVKFFSVFFRVIDSETIAPRVAPKEKFTGNNYLLPLQRVSKSGILRLFITHSNSNLGITQKPQVLTLTAFFFFYFLVLTMDKWVA